MIKITVLYANGKGKTFDHAYYASKHVPMVAGKMKPFGLIKAEIDKGVGSMAPGSPAPFAAIGHLYFDRVEQFQSGMAKHGQEIMADIPNYTNIEPSIQISQLVS
jgi:uncharacterized protein (TIGR02118 family)